MKSWAFGQLIYPLGFFNKPHIILFVVNDAFPTPVSPISKISLMPISTDVVSTRKSGQGR